jgi:excisionase family DNA binding protein
MRSCNSKNNTSTIQTAFASSEALSPLQAPSSSVRVSDGAGQPMSLPDRIEQIGRALTADELASMLTVSRITIFKQAKAGRIPSFRIGTCVRFDPTSVAQWLRKM